MRLLDESDVQPQINIVPMIDVIFTILAFFIVSSLFLSKSEGLPVNLPQASTGQVQEGPMKITVTIDPQGKLLVDKQPVQLEQLDTSIKSLIGANQTALVVLNADKRVEHGTVVQVMDRLRRVPSVKLGIATTKP